MCFFLGLAPAHLALHAVRRQGSLKPSVPTVYGKLIIPWAAMQKPRPHFEIEHTSAMELLWSRKGHVSNRTPHQAY